MKLKLVGLIIIVIILIAAFGSLGGSGGSSSLRSETVPTKAWYEGGNLHDRTVVRWRQATYANKLATAGDWVTVFTTYDDLDEAKELAQDLVECVDGSVDAAPDAMKAAELGASCAILMGWELKSQ